MGISKNRRVTYRRTTVADLALLVDHRHRMWTAIGNRSEAEITEHDPRYRRWSRQLLRSGEIVGIIAEAPDGTAVGSGLVWFRSDQPRPQIPTLVTPYVLSMYTRPDWRGRGIASRILRLLVAHCREAGYPSIVLHASEQGRAVYARLGFERTWEMRFWIDRALARKRARAAGRPRRKEKKRLDGAR